MSQVNVERVIGTLATDEGLRRRFTRNPHAALLEMVERGLELTACELHSLAKMDPAELVRFAHALGPRLQRAELRGGAL
jgi:hypothetical protein